MNSHWLAGSILALMAAGAAPSAYAETPGPDGKLILEHRLRYEAVDQDSAADAATALTARTRFGLRTPRFEGFQALVELENVTSIAGEYADGVHPLPGYPVIADPEFTELNRAQISWTGSGGTSVVAGRQRLILGNGRFIASSAWRQNEQTFDGVVVATKALKPFTLTYGYIGQVNRTLGPNSPLGVWHGEIHLIQADLTTPFGQVSAYDYRLGIDTLPSQSTETFGLRLAGSRALGKSGLALTYEAEIARQADYAGNPGDFTLNYQLAAIGLKGRTASASIVVERLGGDGARGFQTPLASLHQFEGWADVLTVTPASGVRDFYARGSKIFTVAGRSMSVRGEAHAFDSDDGSPRIGRELDAAVQTPLTPHLSLEVAGAAFEASRAPFADTRKLWLTLEYRY